MQDRPPPTRRNLLATHGRTIHWVIRDRCRGSFLPVDVRFAPKATEVLRCREMTRHLVASSVGGMSFRALCCLHVDDKIRILQADHRKVSELFAFRDATHYMPT